MAEPIPEEVPVAIAGEHRVYHLKRGEVYAIVGDWPDAVEAQQVCDRLSLQLEGIEDPPVIICIDNDGYDLARTGVAG